MNPCAERHKLQDLIDEELPEKEAEVLRRHVDACAACRAELALYRRVFRSLDQIRFEEPPAELTERILARVSPARERRRLVRTVGWSYAGSLATCLAGVLVWALQPTSGPMLATLFGEASRRILGLVVFVLNAFAFGILRLADGWELLAAAGAPLAPIQRALVTLLGHPGIELSLTLAALACVLLLSWMRPRKERDGKEIRHVGLLGI